MRHIVFALALTMTLVSGAVAGPFEDAAAAYERGDYKTASRLWRTLAEQGLAMAQLNLGIMYAKGNGVPQDYVQAHMWLNLAAARFPASDAENLNVAVGTLDIVASRMTPAQIAEAQKLAREWKPK
jgi:TPR repeat protein